MSSNRPPRDISAHGFFTDWLPREFAAAFGAGKRAAADITVAVKLSGDEPLDLLLDVKGGTLTVREPGAGGPEPMVSLRQSTADWRAMAVGEEGAEFDLAPPQASPLDVLFVDPQSRQLLNAVRGQVRFECHGYHGRTWSMEVKFGTQPERSEPNATISTDAGTYAQILSRKMAPPEAYFSGKIQVRGDTALAMQLAMGMLPRFVQR